MSANEKDKLLKHEYDGIQELDNHMPRWWVLGFYFTIIFSIVYIVYYHFANGPLPEKEYQLEMAQAPQKSDSAANTAIVAGLTDEASLAEGKSLYATQTCIGCHSPTLGGLVGPNLTDNFALAGCDIGSLANSIKSGYPEKGMPPYGNNKPLSGVQLQKLASYVLSRKGSNPPGAKKIDSQREKKCK